MKWKPDGACEFEKCNLLAAEDGYCPRHSFLIANLGLDKAMVAEFGHLCGQCAKHHEDEPKECKQCEELRCASCAEARTCCIARIAELEEEADGYDDDAEWVRDEAEAIRDSLSSAARERLEAA